MDIRSSSISSVDPDHHTNNMDERRTDSPDNASFLTYLEPSYFDSFYAVDECQKNALETEHMNFFNTSKDTYQCLCGASGNNPCSCSLTRGASADSSEGSTESRNSPSANALPFMFVEGASTTVEKRQVSVHYLMPLSASNIDRMQRRKNQNRAAQERYREKQQTTLTNAMKKIEQLSAELKLVRGQKQHFQVMYEDLEAQLLDLRSKSS